LVLLKPVLTNGTKFAKHYPNDPQ